MVGFDLTKLLCFICHICSLFLPSLFLSSFGFILPTLLENWVILVKSVFKSSFQTSACLFLCYWKRSVIMSNNNYRNCVFACFSFELCFLFSPCILEHYISDKLTPLFLYNVPLHVWQYALFWSTFHLISVYLIYISVSLRLWFA